MIIKKEKTAKWDPCPEYNGISKIVDITPLKKVETKFGEKEVFRFILEIDEEREPGHNWTVSTRPFTVSLHEKAALRQFLDRVIGPLTEGQLEAGINTETLVGTYANIIVEHVQSEDGLTTFANITYISKPKGKWSKWESDYIRIQDRVQAPPPPPKRPAVSKMTPEEKKEYNEKLAKEFEEFFAAVGKDK